jgi:beta-glucosidase
LLAGKMAAQYIHGLQEKGVAATIKHFAANEQETCRFTVNAHIAERALREIYLKPFEIAIKEANPMAVMTSYNILNDHHADSSSFLLKDVLRGQWGWNGLVMSDWGGTNSTAGSLEAGLDLEMPGPTKWRKAETVLEEIKAGRVSEKTINARARNVLEFMAKLGYFKDPSTPEEKSINKPEHQQLIRSVGSQGLVLLKNEDNILPLKKEQLVNKKVALLGFAKEGLIHGGGSASVNAHYRVTAEEGLRAALGDAVEFEYAQGAHTFRQLPLMEKMVVDRDGKPGWTLDFFLNEDATGESSSSQHSDVPAYMPIFVKEAWNSLKATTRFTPTQGGRHYLGMSGLGRSKIIIDGKTVYEQKENCPDSMAFLLGGVKEPEVQWTFEGGKTYTVEVITLKPSKSGGVALIDGYIGFRAGFMLEEDHNKDLLSEAVEVARRSDLAIVFTGHTPDWETEGQDQISFNLPSNGSQDRLVAAVSSTDTNTIVVNCTGVAIDMPWLENVKAVVQAWFPGQEAGNAIADVLTGAVNPSGRLPVSFPRKIEDAPAHGNFPGEYIDGQLHVKYEEGIFVGYRHYDRSEKHRSQVLFPFGYGLSYTTFAHVNPRVLVSDNAENLDVSIEVSNTGSCTGADVVQIYAGGKQASSENPVKELVGFAKVQLEPKESKTVSVRFSTRQLAHFSEDTGRWELEGGEYEVSIGRSVQDIVGKLTVSVGGKSYEL